MRTESRELLAVGIFGSKSHIGERIEMLLRRGRAFSARASVTGVVVSAMVLSALLIAGSLAPRWVAFAQQQALPKFNVASVKPDKSDDNPTANFPLGPGDVYIPNGGRFSATNFPLMTYIAFAYKLQGNQFQSLLSQLPGWAKTDKFDIEARAEGTPTKEQMRLMMRSLLADRFKFATHSETRQVPAYAIVPSKPGKTGPQLQLHPDDPSCTTTAPPSPAPGAPPPPVATVAGGFPAICGGIFGMPPSAPGRVRAAARNVSVATIANFLTSAGDLGRPVLDQTGLAGNFDFLLEWTPEPNSPLTPGADFQPDPSGPTFPEAVKEQLGLKLEPQKGLINVLVVDHVEKPDAN